ncbi:MAG: glycosyltransferase family 4 protein [Blastocatellia bacterium]|nr:glycosyltransferase family 4 protein [Blastocatellia bacterium]
MKVLFLPPNPIEAANTRYRIHQYLPYLASRGIEGTMAPFLTSELFLQLYRPGNTLRKGMGIVRAALGRMRAVLQAGRYDAVFVSREAMLFGPPVIEWALKNLAGRPIVFDFDDAIFESYVSPTYGRLASLLKSPAKTYQIFSMSSHIIAGNEYLASHARRYNSNVTIVPTVVDADLYSSSGAGRPPTGRTVIGWIGSHSTARYLDLLAPALQRLAARRAVLFRVIGAGREIRIPGVEVENRPWRMDSEIEDLHGFDIGVYPIVDDAWSRGKCAFKAIQYMAAGVPVIASPVGMTQEIITHNRNGLLAGATEEWEAGFAALLDRPALRDQLIEAGRETIRAQYSLAVHAPRLAAILTSVAA